MGFFTLEIVPIFSFGMKEQIKFQEWDFDELT